MRRNGSVSTEGLLIVLIAAFLLLVFLTRFIYVLSAMPSGQGVQSCQPDSNEPDPNELMFDSFGAEGFSLDNCDVLFFRGGLALIIVRDGNKPVLTRGIHFAEGMSSLKEQGYTVMVLPLKDLPPNLLAVWATKED